MELVQRAEVFLDNSDEVIFDHAKLILRRAKDGQYFYARTTKRVGFSSSVDISKLQATEIPTEDICPVFDPKFTLAPQPLPPGTYVKRPNLLGYDNLTVSGKLCDLVHDEAEVCEILLKHPHPNVAKYLGCIVDGGRITGLCFAKYDMTLEEKHKRGLVSDRQSCLEGIESGVGHLHHLGLIHNDINPTNIMFETDNPVIIDFDSCQPEGHKLGSKGGTVGWELEGITHAQRENDIYGISKIRELLMGSTEPTKH